MIFLLFIICLYPLPRKISSQKIYHNIANGFQIIPTRLLNTKMGIDAGISSSTSKIFVFSVRDMLVSLCITILLTQPIIDDILNLIYAITTVLDFLPSPIRKLSGLISRWIKLFECINSTLCII